jgi:hypothetical protein
MQAQYDCSVHVDVVLDFRRADDLSAAVARPPRAAARFLRTRVIVDGLRCIFRAAIVALG